MANEFFDDNEQKAFGSLLGVAGADAFEAKLAVLSDYGPSGGTVSAEAFGAKGDGIANDTAAVNAAIAALGGRGVIQFGRGTYVIQGANLRPGVWFKGAGSAHSVTNNQSATIFKLPASPVAGVPMFRLDTSCGEYFDGGGFSDIEFDGLLYSQSPTMPSAPTTTVEADKLRCLDFRQGPKIVIASEDTSAETITTATPHGFTTGDVIGFDIGSGGVLPTSTGTVIAAQPSYFYVNVTSPTSFMVYNTNANAVAGGATGKANITVLGSGTRYVARSIVGIEHFVTERCYFHNFDECIRGSSIVDRSLCYYTVFRYSYVGFQGQEHPRFVNSRFRFCYFGLTGRFVDALIDDSNNFGLCYYGIAPYDVVGAGSNSYLGNVGGTYSINNCTFSGMYFQNVVSFTLGSGNVIAPATYIVGSQADSGTLLYSNSIGVRIQGNNNRVSGFYGEGSAATSFSKAAILLDRNGNTNDCNGNLIQGCVFSLVSGVTGNAAIASGDTKLATPLFGASAHGGFTRYSIRNCRANLGNMRFAYIAPSNGSSQYAEIVDNSVTIVSGGSNTMGASAGVIEAALYSGCDVTNNRIYNVSGTAGSAIKPMTLALGGASAAVAGRVMFNRFDGTWSVAAIDNTVGAPSNAILRGNIGYVTEFAGTATLNGTSNVNVPHGMAITPVLANVVLTAQGDVGAVTPEVVSVDSTNVVISASGAGTGTVNVRASYSP